MSQALPIVAVIGRANTGKSSLFNRLVGERRAIVADLPGTTRDNVFAKVALSAKTSCWLVDTAGRKKADSPFEETIQGQLENSIQAADTLIMVVDGTVGVVSEDLQIARYCLRTKKPILLAVNKIDSSRRVDLSDFRKLGIKEIIRTSAIHNIGIDEIFDKLSSLLPKRTPKVKGKITKIAILGRPNVGKSQMFNALSRTSRAMVSTVAGTTRDVNRTEIVLDDKIYEIMDTAGVRHSGQASRGIEYYSAIRTVAAIDEADICLLLLDCLEPATKLDQKIASMVEEAGKGLILGLNKWDILEKDEQTYKHLMQRIGYEFRFVSWAPAIVVSALTTKNIDLILPLCDDIMKMRIKTFTTSHLNKWLQGVVLHHPPSGIKNKYPKLRYISQTGTRPPSFKVFGSHVKSMQGSYRRYLEHQFRDYFDITGTATKWTFIENRSEKDR